MHLFGDRDAETVAPATTEVERRAVDDRQPGRRLEELEDLVLTMQVQLDEVLARLERLESESGR